MFLAHATTPQDSGVTSVCLAPHHAPPHLQCVATGGADGTASVWSLSGSKGNENDSASLLWTDAFAHTGEVAAVDLQL